MAYWSKGDKERLLEALARVCELGVDFFATFDLRAHQHVHPYITKVLTNLTSGGECWQRLRAAVVQVRENIFTTVRLGLVSAFVRTCLLDPFGPVGATGCPLLICRDDVVAREFCEASHRAWALNGQTFGPLAGSGFVSLDNVSEDRSAPETSSPATSKDVSSAGCVASLAPGIRRPGRGIAAPGSTTLPAAAITTLHELPNGDVRVIQSPARDVVLSSASSSSGSKSDTDSTAAGSSSKGGSAATSTGSIHSSGSGTDLSRSVAALKFECPAERLQPLVGTHLHVGELVFDAEVESYKRRYTALQEKHYQGTTVAHPLGLGHQWLLERHPCIAVEKTHGEKDAGPCLIGRQLRRHHRLSLTDSGRQRLASIEGNKDAHRLMLCE
eukprot:CAMPEP_0178390566 /NCGR_PEP_ID=MMETSP0689_2-20121128/10713_1 /TAXON_ID=160604 /ORGANISM="Amphidinium massartii, Strain CS-259" /LENGTH=384 /DNA_ID=CAMNT_0020011081 /DNA_START=219 /DNA_END=1372 /DNA_ORIENTATION=+